VNKMHILSFENSQSVAYNAIYNEVYLKGEPRIVSPLHYRTMYLTMNKNKNKG